MGSRILIAQTGFLGDAVLSTALVASLAARDDVDTVGLLVRAGYAELFENHPGIALLYGLKKGDRAETAKMRDLLTAGEFDVALIPHRSLSTALLCAGSRIPERIGFRVADAPLLYSMRVDYRLGEPEVVRNNDLLRAWSREEDRGEIPLTWLPGPVRDIVHPVQPRTVAIAHGSVWRTKQWGWQRYAELSRRLIGEGIRPILVGSPDEREEGVRIAERAGIPAEDLRTGELSLSALASLLGSVALTISNDSGAMHVSEGVGTPVVALFGPTIREFGFAPLLKSSVLAEVPDLSCRPCGIHGGDRCPLQHHQCMELVSVDMVLGLVMDQIAEIQEGGVR